VGPSKEHHKKTLNVRMNNPWRWGTTLGNGEEWSRQGGKRLHKNYGLGGEMLGSKSTHKEKLGRRRLCRLGKNRKSSQKQAGGETLCFVLPRTEEIVWIGTGDIIRKENSEARITTEGLQR